MLIIGNTPDLFDHMPFVYGVDNKVVFDKRVYENMGDPNVTDFELRNDCSVIQHYDNKHGWQRDYFIDGEIYDSWRYSYRKNNPNPPCKYKLLNFFYCGEVYLIAQKLVFVEGHYESRDEYHFVYETLESTEVYKIKAHIKILEFSKINNIPYFIYDTKGQYVSRSKLDSAVHVFNKYIPLRYIKMDNIERFNDVNLMYNDVYNYMLSLKNDNDTIVVSNKDKITQAGFDLKTSFRKM